MSTPLNDKKELAAKLASDIVCSYIANADDAYEYVRPIYDKQKGRTLKLDELYMAVYKTVLDSL